MKHKGAIMQRLQRYQSKRQPKGVGLQDSNGQALAESALLLSLIVLVCVGAVAAFGVSVSGLYDQVVAAWP